MAMIFDIPFQEVVEKRHSVRSYMPNSFTNELKIKIKDYINTLSNPFDEKVSFKFIDIIQSGKEHKLGTYGVIKGASAYIGAIAKSASFELEAIGYEFEKLILYAASLGLGTCWLGGTFQRNEFVKALNLSQDEYLPIISPIGIESEKRNLVGTMIRKIAKSDQRKAFEDIFYEADLSKPLTESNAGDFAFPLEMVRLAPSASNKQPWRIVKDGSVFHFYEYKEPGYSDRFAYDIQRIDVGIAACHFHLALMEKGKQCEMKVVKDKISNLPTNVHYSFSFFVS